MSVRNHTRGFTLIELVVLVAIFGILAAVAVPNVIRLQLRGRTAEALTNLASLQVAEQGVYAELGSFVTARSAPGGVPGPMKRPWVGGNVLEFRELIGWRPDGDVYFQYGANADGDQLTLAAVGDVDGDGAVAQFGLVLPLEGESTGLPGSIGTCALTGVYNPETRRPDLLGTVGPCSRQDGRSQF
jgi:type IV pilus assembly protein PilA